MFEHFTFGAVAQPTHQDDLDINPSPTDTSFASPSPVPSPSIVPSPPSQQGINDLVSKLSSQSLTRDNNIPHQFNPWSHAPTSPIEVDSDEEMPEEMSAFFASSVPATPSETPATTCRRLQRQLNTQLQTSHTHIRDINALVSGMVSSSTQYRLHKSTSRTYFPSPPQHLLDDDHGTEPRGFPEIDEGFHDDDDNNDDAWARRMQEELEREISLRRASNPSGIRKYGGLRWGRSADVPCVGGRAKVRSLPRMRRRKNVVRRDA